MEREVKSDAVYNEWDNMVYVRSNGDLLHIICNKEEQMDAVNKDSTELVMNSLGMKNGMKVKTKDGL